MICERKATHSRARGVKAWVGQQEPGHVKVRKARAAHKKM